MENKLKEIIFAAWLHGTDIFRKSTNAEKSSSGTESDFHKTLKDFLPDDIDRDTVLDLLNSYQNPNSYESKLLAQSIHLSIGDTNGFSQTTHAKPLINILSTLHLSERKEAQPNYIRPSALKEQALLDFMQGNETQKKEVLYTEFFTDFKKLKGLSYAQFLPALVSLLEHYWWCIPVDDKNWQDISLFQYVKMTAAFAAALYRYHEETDSLSETALYDNGQKKFRIINGDMSGIQKYIFGLKIPKNAAKLLRARSFQLWALSEIIADYLINEFGLSSANIITTAGGKFLILIQNTPASEKLLAELQLKFESYFLKEFAGTLFFILSNGVAFSSADLMSEHIANSINQLGVNAEECKQFKMQKALQANGHILHELYTELQKKGLCDFCAVFPADKDDNGYAVCPHCDALKTIGERLVKANKIIFHSEKLKQDAPFRELVEIKIKTDKAFGYVINDFEAGLPLINLPYIAPKDTDTDIKSFEDIAKDARGVKKLAMFKADIDNLGLIFTASLGNRMSLLRYAEVSRILHYFFSSYYVHIIEANETYKNKIYTVFSGGDDLCVIGAWDVIMDFAYDFRKELQKLTNNNPSITLSGGIALASSSLPVRSIAKEAENQLDLSKDFSDGGELKNAISVFGTTLGWEQYREYVSDGKNLADWIKNDILATAPVYKLIDFANRAKRVRQGYVLDSVWISNFRYMFARNIKSKEGNTEPEKIFSKFATPQTVEKARISASYALYANRTNSQRGGE